MILAAGRGERMKPLTNHTPKPLLKVDRYSLIEHQILSLKKAGITEIIINICYLHQQFIEQLGDGSNYGVKIQFSIEADNTALGTGGGIKKALSLIGTQPLIITSGDLWTNFPYQQLTNQNPAYAHLVLVDNPKHHLQGDFSLADGIINSTDKEKLNYAGIGVINPKHYQLSNDVFCLFKPLKNAILENQVTGEYYSGTWCNVGTPKQLEQIQIGVKAN